MGVGVGVPVGAGVDVGDGVTAVLVTPERDTAVTVAEAGSGDATVATEVAEGVRVGVAVGGIGVIEGVSEIARVGGGSSSGRVAHRTKSTVARHRMRMTDATNTATVLTSR